MTKSAPVAGRHPPLQFELNLAVIFAMLGILVTTLVTLHWFVVLEPALRADAKSHSRVLAQAQASAIEQRLGGGRPEMIRGELGTALDGLLLLEDQATGLPFMRRIALTMNYEDVDGPPGSLDMARGVEACPECFVSEIPLYHPRDRQLIGIATFYGSPQCLETMVADFRIKLLWGGVAMLGFIAFAWVGVGRLLRRLGESEANLRSLFEAAPIPMVLHEQGVSGVSRANQAAKDYLALHEDGTGRYTSDAWRTLEASGLPACTTERHESRTQTEEGDERWALVSTAPLQLSDGPSQLVSLVDVSELKAVQHELSVASVTDGLTGLYNRRHLFRKLAQEVDRANRGAYPFSIIVLDLDHFKRVNDTFGHRAGDEVLVQVAAAVRASIRDLDIAGRFGGEEFMVILPYAKAPEALDVAERIRSRIKALAWTEPGLCMTTSGGVCEYAGLDIDAFVEAADRKLYEAKAAGRDRVIG